MADWTGIVGVVVGAVAAGGFSIGGQLLTNNGITKRESEARRDAFRTRQAEIERETILELQAEIVKHIDVVAARVDLVMESESLTKAQALAAEMNVLRGEMRITMLMSRCRAGEAVELVDKYLQVTRILMLDLDPSSAPSANPRVPLLRAQEALGEALRAIE